MIILTFPLPTIFVFSNNQTAKRELLVWSKVDRAHIMILSNSELIRIVRQVDHFGNIDWVCGSNSLYRVRPMSRRGLPANVWGHFVHSSQCVVSSMLFPALPRFPSHHAILNTSPKRVALQTKRIIWNVGFIITYRMSGSVLTRSILTTNPRSSSLFLNNFLRGLNHITHQQGSSQECEIEFSAGITLPSVGDASAFANCHVEKARAGFGFEVVTKTSDVQYAIFLDVCWLFPAKSIRSVKN